MTLIIYYHVLLQYGIGNTVLGMSHTRMSYPYVTYVIESLSGSNSKFRSFLGIINQRIREIFSEKMILCLLALAIVRYSNNPFNSRLSLHVTLPKIVVHNLFNN